jgi:lysozyme family protein
MMTSMVALKAQNGKRWVHARTTRDFSSVARCLVAPHAKAKYLAVSAKTGVPWFIVAVIHQRECSQDWAGSLAQGDPWDRVSIHVPAGRGPFKSWEDAAVDALEHCAPHAARNQDWSPGGALTSLEEYNGLGYAVRGLPSPYIWSGTDQYVGGKYVRDGVFDPSVVDRQLGCAGLIMAMMKLDSTIAFTGLATVPTKTTPMPTKKPTANPTIPAKGSIGAFVAAIFNAIFKRK